MTLIGQPTVALRPSVPDEVRTREEASLARYATFSSQSAGRVHWETPLDRLGPFEIDRDRVLQSVAFRRLGGKTQVFTSDWGEDHRTRLTHTIEVSSVARSIGQQLRLNVTLIEALALAHDLGHPPLGHAGEQVLDDCLSATGGFNHNRQGLRILERLERCEPGFEGLNLTVEVLAGQRSRADREQKGIGASLEAQVVEAADSAVYDTHDADDALRLGFLDLGDLLEVPLWAEAAKRVRRDHADLEAACLRQLVLRELLHWQMHDLAAQFQRQQDQRAEAMAVSPSAEMAELKGELERMMYQRVYRHPQLLESLDRAGQKLRWLFEIFARRPDWLPSEARVNRADESTLRVIGDYLAGLTDRSLEREFCDLQAVTARRAGRKRPLGTQDQRAA